ncbi:MAG: PAS domain-containing sensor histidine kinase [Candidatus Obscuribacterales bacterium]|nr:PAS domain-containing sensor histidine kinase [Candidatus Obscuribacterales bacterium]
MTEEAESSMYKEKIPGGTSRLFRSSLSRQGFIIIAVPLLLSFFFIAGLKFLLDDAQMQADREAHSRQIMTSANALGNSVVFAVSDYLLDAMMPESYTRARYESAMQRARVRMNELEALLPNAGQQKEMADSMRRDFAMAAKVIQSPRATGENAAAEMAERSRSLREITNALLADMRRIIEAEEAQLKSEGRTFRGYGRMIDAFLLVAVGLNMVLAAVLMFGFLRNISRRLLVVMDNSNRLVADRELNPPLEGADEIGKLDNVLHEAAIRLKEARRRERAIVENAREVICSLNAQGVVLEVNQACVTAWGHRQDELVRGPIARIIHDQDSEMFLEKLAECIAQNSALSFECRLITGSGVLKDVLWSMQWSDAEGRAFCVVLDITERKRAEEALKLSEERMRSVFEMMPLVLVVMTQEGEIVSANPAAEQHFGVPANDLIKLPVTDLFRQDKNSEKRADLVELMNPPLHPAKRIYGRKSDGMLFPVEVMSTAYDTSSFKGRLLIVKDVSREYEADRLKQSFMAMVGHELKSPLMSIHVCLQMLGKGFFGGLTEEGQESVKTAEDSVLRLIGLVNEILDAEKLESGSISIAPQKTNLDIIFDMASNAVSALAEAHKIRVHKDRVDVEITADTNRLVQVLVNLLSNAIKFSPPNSKVQLYAKVHENAVEVSVEDIGRGVPKEHQHLVFERFHQVLPGDAKEKGGTGLGLAICKAIVEAHGGSIGVESEPPNGSRFWFVLPR